MWNQVKDHCNALPPENQKKWLSYEFLSDDFGPMVGVNFKTGIFTLHNELLHPATIEGESLTYLENKQDFKCDESRDILNGMNYFPVYGRKIIKGDWGEARIYFCGWKIMHEGKKIEKTAFLYPNGQISIT